MESIIYDTSFFNADMKNAFGMLVCLKKHAFARLFSKES
jgi:hypothetical protein